MSYEMEKLPDEPIILITLHADWNMRETLPGIIEALGALLDDLDEDVYFVSHLSPEVPFSVNDIVWSANVVGGSGGTILRHPRIKAYLSVAPNRLLAMAAEGMRSATFGKLNVHTFATVDDALAFARSGE